MNRRRFLSSALASAVTGKLSGERLKPFVAPATAHTSARVPIIDVTDLYHPFQDVGDNFDLLHAYSLPEVDLRAVILDVTSAFRLPVADDPMLWHDPNGPREPGYIPVLQLNAIFDRAVPFAVAPYSRMQSLEDKMLDTPAYQQQGIELILNTLRTSSEKIAILSFGSCRSIAAAFNRDPHLFREKVRCIHISGGTAPHSYERRGPQKQNRSPERDWNVALDPLAFRRLLGSDLPIALYPCSGLHGGYDLGVNNTYWSMENCHFIRQMDPRIRNYLLFALGREIRADYLRALDMPMDESPAANRIDSPHHIWETAIWLNVASLSVVQQQGGWRILPSGAIRPDDRVLRYRLEPCTLGVDADARISFQPASVGSNFSIFVRDDPTEYQTALRDAWPALLQAFRSKSDA